MAISGDSSSEDEVVARGVQPYRFEPRRRIRIDEEESDPGDLTVDNVSF